MEKKKKSANFIIPATFFTSLSPAAIGLTKSIQHKEVNLVIDKPTVSATKVELQKPVLKNVTRRASSLSLKSVHLKKEEKTEVVLDENYDNHPKEKFTQKQLEKSWNAYHAKLIEKGQKSIAATLISNIPILGDNFEITFDLPNSLMSDQVEREKPKLLAHLRKDFNNYALSISVIVNETVTKKFAYTPQEKYTKMLEKNPVLAKLKDTFKLDI